MDPEYHEGNALVAGPDRVYDLVWNLKRIARLHADVFRALLPECQAPLQYVDELLSRVPVLRQSELRRKDNVAYNHLRSLSANKRLFHQIVELDL